MKWRKGWKQDKRRKKPSIAAAKLLRCLQIINVLETSRMTIDQMVERFDVSERTIYRYIILFEEVGYSIDRDFNRKFFIFQRPEL